MADYVRSPTRLMFAKEMRDCEISYQDGDDQFAVTHVVSPTGENVHRVLMVGAVTEKEDIGSDTEYWRLRIVDPTGSILAYAGQYQPDAMHQADQLEVPQYVAVLGKMKLFITEDGTVISSISAENIIPVTVLQKNQFLYFAARNSLSRLLEPDESNKSVTMAKEHYSIDKAEYFKMVNEVIESLEV